MENLIFDEETLESITFERSKNWSTFLKYAAEDDGVEIKLDEIEEFFKDQDEKSVIEMEEAEETEEDEIEEQLENISKCASKAERTLYKSDDKDIINQTAPIVEEHVRKWKEAGLDVILDTFDGEQIEEHVGGWLRRHNSVYADKSPKTCTKRHKNVPRKLCLPDASPDSEAESMHSLETAHYIRASRKRTVSFGSKCGSPMTTIKMYRTLPCKRDELRKKYSYDVYNDEQEHRHHMQALLHRRDQMHRRKRDIVFHTSPRHYSCSMAKSASVQQRRKQLRKRRDSSPRFSSLSSSEDEHGHDLCQCSACVRRMFSRTEYPYRLVRNYNIHLKHSIHKMRHLAFEDDRRPRLMENDCSCCDSDRLCNNVVHIANSSTEDWLVENRSSPDELKLCTVEHRSTQGKSTKYKTHTQKIKHCVDLKENISEEKYAKQDNYNVPQKDDKEVKKTKSKICKKSEATKSNTSSKSPATAKAKPVCKSKLGIKDKSLSKSPPKGAIPKEKLEVIKPLLLKPTPVSKSKLDIKEKNSSKTPQKKTIPKQKTDVPNSVKKDKKLNEKCSETGTKPKLVQNKAPSSNSKDTSSDSDEDLKTALKLSQKSYVQELERSRQKAAEKLQTALETSDKSLFNNQSVACNSTALCNETASRRALNAEKSVRRVKCAVAGSRLTPIIDLSDSEPKDLKINLDHDADCTVVTSTTGCESSKPSGSESTLMPQRSDIKLTKKGILLYTPPTADQSKNNNSTITNGNFTLTEDCLSPIIGRQRAKKFFAYHIGSRTFDSSCSVYYRPTPKIAAALNVEGRTLDLSSSSSGSDFDIFERVGRYGNIYTETKK